MGPAPVDGGCSPDLRPVALAGSQADGVRLMLEEAAKQGHGDPLNLSRRGLGMSQALAAALAGGALQAAARQAQQADPAYLAGQAPSGQAVVQGSGFVVADPACQPDLSSTELLQGRSLEGLGIAGPGMGLLAGLMSGITAAGTASRSMLVAGAPASLAAPVVGPPTTVPPCQNLLRGIDDKLEAILVGVQELRSEVRVMDGRLATLEAFLGCRPVTVTGTRQ
ncbi:hypothetical protein V8C86DRAFT_3131205 [Haematococcus lacustris]